MVHVDVLQAPKLKQLVTSLTASFFCRTTPFYWLFGDHHTDLGHLFIMFITNGLILSHPSTGHRHCSEVAQHRLELLTRGLVWRPLRKRPVREVPLWKVRMCTSTRVRKLFMMRGWVIRVEIWQMLGRGAVRLCCGVLFRSITDADRPHPPTQPT